jgi:cell division protein FtsZ
LDKTIILKEVDIMENVNDDFEINVVDTMTTTGARIKAIGVGGGGGNMINHMIQEGIDNIDLIVANTDAQALASSLAPFKLQLGVNATRGLGAGMIPEKGKEAAIESYKKSKICLRVQI